MTAATEMRLSNMFMYGNKHFVPHESFKSRWDFKLKSVTFAITYQFYQLLISKFWFGCVLWNVVLVCCFVCLFCTSYGSSLYNLISFLTSLVWCCSSPGINICFTLSSFFCCCRMTQIRNTLPGVTGLLSVWWMHATLNRSLLTPGSRFACMVGLSLVSLGSCLCNLLHL